MRATTNFQFHEWCCKCGCIQDHQMEPKVMLKIQQMRDALGPMSLTSAWRCSSHPAESSKIKPGQHNLGTAVDIKVTSGAHAFQIISLALSLGANGFAIGQGFVHIDWRTTTPVTWRY
jgi:uncharacterized protein YcbK (DUF882 family)